MIPILEQRARTIERMTREWPADRKVEMQEYLLAQRTRISSAARYKHPAQLAQAIDPQYVITPAIELISRSIERVLREPNRNLLVTMPPQQGKSQLCSVWTPLRALQINPDSRVVLATYAQGLAEEHSHMARDQIMMYGANVIDAMTGTAVTDRLGLELREDRAAVSRWRIKGGKGGMIAVGLGGTLSGRPADLLIIDDPYKNMVEADSHKQRQNVEEWLRSVAMTRLSPTASIVLIQTRWHPDDLAGMIIKNEAAAPKAERTWRHINIPAVSEDGVPDALNREPGTAMSSTRGHTPEQFRAIRKAVGERVWFALYQGMPVPPEGGLFSRQWFIDHRVMEAPPHPVMSVVAVDPAETGENDEAGIVAAAMYPDGTTLFTHDRSERLTSDRWARVAVQLALEVNAREIAVEAYATATTYSNVIKGAYRGLLAETRDKHRKGEPLAPWEQRLVSSERMPFTVHQWRGKGDAVARSAYLRQAIEVGSARVLGFAMSVLEDQAALWQAGSHQPDRVAAALIAHARLMAMKGTAPTYANPMASANRRDAGANAWLGRRIA